MSLLITLAAIGVDLTALSIFGGALGVGLGFGMQKLAANYVSGFVVLFERSVRIGDNIRIDNFEGRITDITTRYTLVRSINGREAVIPNEKLMTERVENLSLSDRKLLLTSQLSVAYDSDVSLVRNLLTDAAKACPRVLADPSPVAHLASFGPDGLDFTLCYWILDPENGQLNVQSEVNMAVLTALRSNGIEIPYPQRVVHLKHA
jgi:small-conductance mechanosensitive channel